MTKRLSRDEARKLRAARRALERRLALAAFAELQWMWQRVQQGLTELEQHKPSLEKTELFGPGSTTLWEEFRQRLDLRISNALLDGAITIYDIYIAAWSDQPDEVRIVPEELVSIFKPVIGEMITQVAENTKQAVSDAVDEWYNTPEATLQDLTDRLQPEFGERRAQLIAITETTRLNSGVVRQTMTRLGLHHWRHETRNDEMVCDRCGPLNGQVFTLNDPMPPESTHPGCRCNPVPVFD